MPRLPLFALRLMCCAKNGSNKAISSNVPKWLPFWGDPTISSEDTLRNIEQQVLPYMGKRLTYKTIELIIYVIIQVYAKIGTYLITCLLYFWVKNQ